MIRTVLLVIGALFLLAAPAHAQNGPTPTINGNIVVGHCLEWTPGIGDAGVPCGATGPITIGTTSVSGGVNGQCIYDNNGVAGTISCGGGGGGSLTVTDGSTTVTGTTQVTFNGASVSGTTPNASVTISGGAGQTNFTTHAALIAATTAFSTNSLMQQGYYSVGDGGAAFYDWNATSYCPNGSSGSPTAADGNVCILPSGQSSSTTGRYLIRQTNGQISARWLGFRDDGQDNAPYIAGANTVLQEFRNPALVFTNNATNNTSNFWFTQPLRLLQNTSIICDSGSRSSTVNPEVNLVFTPGVDGIQQDDFINTIAAVIHGCAIQAGGDYGEGVISVAGTNTITAPQLTYKSWLGNGSRIRPNPVWAVGDSMLSLTFDVGWEFSASITGNIMTVTSPVTGSSTTDPGIAPGQFLLGSDSPPNPPNGIYIQQQLTNTGAHPGQQGTYLLSYSIAEPFLESQAVPGTISGTYFTFPPNNRPTLPMGSVITSCTGGTQCTPGGTLTVNNNWNQGVPTFMYLLPGPNSLQGDQSYHVTTTLTGHTYGPITAGISGSTLTVTGGGGSLAPGQTIIGGNGSPVSTTTTGNLTIGEYTNIPVASCSGITSGMYVVGFSSGNSVFPFETAVASCTSGLLTLESGSPSGLIPSLTSVTTTAGSPIVTMAASAYNYGGFWIGEPINSANGYFSTPTTVVSTQIEPWNSLNVDVTLSNTSTTSGFDTIYFGGAQFAAPSGTTLTFLNGIATIDTFGTGTGGNGTYNLDTFYTLSPGSTVYAYDTPSTIYVTQGPRAIVTGDLIASDAFALGGTAFDAYYTANNQQTIVMTQTAGANYWISASTAHSSGSGRMWVLPTGLWRPSQGSSTGNFITGFAGAGIMMPCGGGYPETGCGKSYDSDNFYYNNGVGRVVTGDNSGGSSSTFNQYDHNWLADIYEDAGVGSTYQGELLQGEDESTNSHDMELECGTNGSTFTGVYASGSQWEASCVGPTPGGMLSVEPTGANFGIAWYGSIFQQPYDAVYGGFQLSLPIDVWNGQHPGGVPYFNNTHEMDSSATLGANDLMIGGGPGVAPSTIVTGNNVISTLNNPAGQTNGVAIEGITIQNGTAALSSGTATLALNGPLQTSPTCITADVTTPTNNSYAVESIAGWNGTASALETYVSNSAAAAFPNGTGFPTQGWGSNSTIPVWLEYDFGSSTYVVTEYTIFRSVDQPGAWFDNDSPANWQFQGSNDNSTWTTLDDETGTTQFIPNGTSANYSFSNSTAYRYYRIYITAGTSGGGGYVNITTLNMMATGLGGISVVLHGTGTDTIKYICTGQ